MTVGPSDIRKLFDREDVPAIPEILEFHHKLHPDQKLFVNLGLTAMIGNDIDVLIEWHRIRSVLRQIPVKYTKESQLFIAIMEASNES